MDVLTEREREVVALVAQGLTNDEVATELVVSPATARTHVSRAMVKLYARPRPAGGLRLPVRARTPAGVARSVVLGRTTRDRTRRTLSA